MNELIFLCTITTKNLYVDLCNSQKLIQDLRYIYISRVGGKILLDCLYMFTVYTKIDIVLLVNG